jgi:glycosyltransferase involved in cell wall biosynthesis
MVKVSIVMITYNHELYIKEAILGVLAQATEFDFELIVADDCSSDKTEFVVNEIITTHPKSNVIKYTRHASNKGMIPNFIWALEQCNGDYIALCEGDDYWTDPYKLQKQVDFLEANPEYVICFHPISILELDGKINEDYLTNVPSDYGKLESLIRYGNYIHTPSVVFRNILDDYPDIFLESPIGDYILYILISEKGSIGIINEKMAVYRRGTGVWSSLDSKTLSMKNFKTLLLISDYLTKNNFQLAEIINSKIRRNHINTLKYLTSRELNELRTNQSISLILDQLIVELHESYEQLSFKHFDAKTLIKESANRVLKFKIFRRFKWFQ